MRPSQILSDKLEYARRIGDDRAVHGDKPLPPDLLDLFNLMRADLDLIIFCLRNCPTASE